MMQRIIQGAANRYRWWSYKQRVLRRWQEWDAKSGGKYAADQINSFKLLFRPSFNPIALNDPIFQDAHYQACLPLRIKQIHQEYVYHIPKPCYIEPEFGYVIMEPAVLIPESIAWAYIGRMPHLLHTFSGVPTVQKYEEARHGKQPVLREKIVISLRHIFDTNYGHCLVQLMSALFLLDECGVSDEIPIVVSFQLGQLPFFQEMIRRGALSRRRWIVQGDSYLHVQEVIFAATEWPSRALLNRFLDAIEVPQGTAEAQKRLFIQRRSRQLSNMDTLMPVLNKLGFEPVRPEEFTFAEQIALFAQAEIVCGVLGAALTNVIFRRDAPVKILEIQAANERDLFFYSLAKTCGYSHFHLIGSRYETEDRFSNFSVEPEQFRSFLTNAVNVL